MCRPGEPRRRTQALPRGSATSGFDRSGYRVPGVIVSPWVDEGIVISEEYRHTSLLATLRKVWDIGDPFTDRDAAARSFEHVLSREIPRDPATWPEMHPTPLPDWQLTKVAYGQAISTLGKAIGPRLD